MQRRNILRVVLLAAACLVGALAAQQQVAVAKPAAVNAAVALPPVLRTAPLGGRLADPRPESPSSPIDELPDCAACRLAAQTTGQIPRDALSLRSEILENGVAVRVSSRDSQAREVLWRATVTRGELLADLRAGEPIRLCESCRAGLERRRELRIEARRTTDGVLLVYTSGDLSVVRDLQQVARDLAVTTF